ncbi:MAG: fasciclin domain-containing protein [Bacteroidaceae bacterium]|nr:fasciclin domain-containing protein [Bacteroidaceae bacterium]
MRKIRKYICSLLALVGLLALSACADTWDNHYDEQGNNVSDKTLWDEIASRSELGAFRQLLESCGYDKTLDGDQMLTVFAPAGVLSLDGTLTADEKVTEVIENHVCRFAVSASPLLAEPKNILMLNGKRGLLKYEGGAYQLAGKRLTETNIRCRNGILHIVEGQLPFFCNVWEYMSKGTDYTKVCDYLYSFNELVLDEEASVPGAVVDGQITYVDSVVINYNEMLYRLGKLNDEDSLYWMILPTNDAWEKAYERVSGYYCYNEKNAERDSLQRHYAQLAIVNDLVFSQPWQPSPLDSIVSTTNDTFYRPLETLLPEYGSFGDGIECSNGMVFPVDTLRFKPWESWHKRLQVEAENTRGREYTDNCDLYKRNLSAASAYYSKVSQTSYVEVMPKSVSANPSITFSVPNVLSAEYDVKVVFLPQTLSTDRSNVGLPNKLLANLSYVDEKGKTATVKSSYLYPDAKRIDTVTVLENIRFPFCNYGETETTTKLKIQSQVLSKERSDYSRTLLIDCIILEPVKR